MMRTARSGMLATAGVATVLVLAAGCSSSSTYGSSSSTKATLPSAAAGPTSTGPAAAAATVLARPAKSGTVLTDRTGMTLYMFDKDAVGASTSACAGACATRWPALTASGTPTAGPGVPGQLTVVGSGSQVAWNGKLLYLFSGDKAPGDTNGDGVGGVWHVATPSAATSGPTTTMVVGGY